MAFPSAFKMSILSFFRTPINALKKDLISSAFIRTVTTGKPALCEVKSETETEAEPESAPESAPEHPRKVTQHPLQRCIEYMDSKAYHITYGDKPVWTTYVRNFRGYRAPETRESCIIGGQIKTGSPCPICRDQYLLPDYRNVKLLKQFISPFGGHILPTNENFDSKLGAFAGVWTNQT